jgi:hypothetical protein
MQITDQSVSNDMNVMQNTHSVGRVGVMMNVEAHDNGQSISFQGYAILSDALKACSPYEAKVKAKELFDRMFAKVNGEVATYVTVANMRGEATSPVMTARMIAYRDGEQVGAVEQAGEVDFDALWRGAYRAWLGPCGDI